MRAAVISSLGELPEIQDVAEPEPGAGEIVVEVLAAPLNPIDVNVGAGRFYGGHPDPPFVPGCEAVGRASGSDGLVWVHGPGIGTKRDGTLAERIVVPEDALFPVPEAVAPALAAALGIAGLAGWVPLAWRAPVRPDDTVLVLGATGTVGLVAVQAARRLGARRVVAAGRRPQGLARARDLGADEAVRLDADDLVTAFREACGGDGPTLVFDAVWGEPLAAALDAAARGARVLNVGQSASPRAELASAWVRGKQLEILGYSNYAVPRDVLAAEYCRLVEAARDGDIAVDVEEVPFEELPDAWRRQSHGAGRKLVVVR